MKLDLFKICDGLTDDKLNYKFKLLNNKEEFKGEQKIVCDWTEGFRDRDKKIIKEFQTTFHSSFWEFFLYTYFKDCAFTLNQEYTRPDFYIEKPYRINVEAVTANIKQNGRKESDRGMLDIVEAFVPPRFQENFNLLLDEAIIRYSNSIIKKSEKYKKEYSKENHVNGNTPFAIALGSFDQVNYGREYIYPLMALLYGKYYNPQLDVFEERNSILKPGTNSEIKLGLFNSSEFSNISAIIFSCTVTLGKLTALSISQNNMSYYTNNVYNLRRDFMDDSKPYKVQRVSSQCPESISDGVFVFHNPYAKNKIPIEVFEYNDTTQYFIKNGNIAHTANTFPIVARINAPKFITKYIEDYICEIMQLYCI